MTTNEAQKPLKKMQWSAPIIVLVAGILLIATTLRTPLTVVGPIITPIRESLQISYVLAGFLTTIPLIAFAVVSPVAPRIARRLGMELTLFMSMIILALGIALRSFGAISPLIIGTILIGVAISFGNVLIPSFIKLKFPLQVGLIMGLYSVSMNLAGGFGAGLSYPIAQASSYGWQMALAFSIILVILAIIIWLPQLKNNEKAASSNTTATTKRMPLWRSPLAWAVAATMGGQSLIFYVSSAWLPEIFIAQGLSPDTAGWMVSIMQLSQLPLTFAIPIIADKLSSQKPLVILCTALYIIGFGGIALGFTSLTILWMICLGCAGGSAFSLTMMLFTLRTKTIYGAADLSGFAQSAGYLLAAIGPITFGLLHDITGGWTIPLWSFLGIVAIFFMVAMYASQDKYIED